MKCLCAAMLPLVLTLCGCLSPKLGKVWVHPGIQEYQVAKIQVFPFEDRVRSKKPLLSEDSEMVTCSIESALDRAGITVLPREKLDTLVAEKNLVMTEVSEEQGLELAKELGADTVVYGLLTVFEIGDCKDAESAVGFVLKGVKADGWTDLFRGGIERRSAEPDRCAAEILAAQGANDLVAKLVAGGIGPTNEL